MLAPVADVNACHEMIYWPLKLEPSALWTVSRMLERVCAAAGTPASAEKVKRYVNRWRSIRM